MCKLSIILFLLTICVQHILMQTTPTIYFTVTTTTPRSPPSTVTPSPTQAGCRCVPFGTCPTTPPGIDIRIVNIVTPTCPTGQVWCCGSPGNLMTSCGTRKVTNSPSQPVGTARYGYYPWQVALLTLDNMYIGSGALISPNMVLTVAHKVQPYSSGNFKLRLGDWNGQTTNEPNPYIEFQPQGIAIHQNYNSQNLQNDIAVVRLNGNAPVNTAPNVNTICLPTSTVATGTRCWVSGWGKNAFGSDGRYQALLKEVDVPIVDQGSCEIQMRSTKLGNFFVLDKTSFICAGGETGKDACTGDGGAPLVCQSNSGQFQVYGLVSWGIGCASSGVPGAYVNVLNYVPWINQQMAAMG